MKSLFTVLLCLCLTATIIAQPTISGGLLGAANFSKFDLKGEGIDDLEYSYRLGWSGGIYMNFPLSERISLEPQLQFSLYEFEDDDRLTLLPHGKLGMFTIPILLKLNIAHDFAVTLGPQVDILHNVYNEWTPVDEENFASPILSGSLGVELFPHRPVTVFARYVHPFTDIDDRDTPDNEYRIRNWQVGLKLRLFGSFTPPDDDNDGIPNRDDKCPTVPGLAAFEGCPDTDGDGITDALDKCPSIAGLERYEGCPIPDTDMDGVNDEVDKCIDVKGVAKYDGCPIPDGDGDGVNDEEDKCPTVAGLAKYNGCPIPDTDGDGINDENDQCPTVAGLAQHNGCPPPDRDNDGVLNDVDLCPDTPGPASNNGCPVVESATFNARMINFVSGSAELTAQSKRNLREGAALMNSAAFNNLVFHIHGHTDNVGSDASNHTLSHRRAESVRAELIKNGVPANRMTSEGFGETKPIATNDTAEGRALNRRVEILARHTQPVPVPNN
jgi:outer membrane protein OmpA-like peptidoglycan-associated protein